MSSEFDSITITSGSGQLTLGIILEQHSNISKNTFTVTEIWEDFDKCMGVNLTFTDMAGRDMVVANLGAM